MMVIRTKILKCDVLVVGGGAAGCYSALVLSDKTNRTANVIIAEKANIKRSGCLAGGVNSLNGYINEGYTPNKYVDYVKEDSHGIIREDLVISMARHLRRVTRRIERLGLTIHRNEEGRFIARGKRSIRINGENIKLLLAKGVSRLPNVKVLNKVNIYDYIIKNGRVIGAYGFSVVTNLFYVIYARAVICATGGAAGLYKPRHPEYSRNKTWYCPFNMGAGYAMGIRAGAEMTTFEMRFIALRCKDTISPTGTIAQGLKTRQINALGEDYQQNYEDDTTAGRLYSTVEENRQGRGPCYLATKGISPEQEEDLIKAFLNMHVAQPMRWVDSGLGPSQANVEIEGTEPYVVGGHAGSGYWVDRKRRTTLKGLYAAGDVAGGSPKKYVTGCFAEALIASRHIKNHMLRMHMDYAPCTEASYKRKALQKFFDNRNAPMSIREAEEKMQDVMDRYAGGISCNYTVEPKKLEIAQKEIQSILDITPKLSAADMADLLKIHELTDRLYVCLALIHHMLARKESRWGCYFDNAEYPRDDEHWLKYVNSVFKDGEFKTIFRDLVPRNVVYEHQD